MNRNNNGKIINNTGNDLQVKLMSIAGQTGTLGEFKSIIEDCPDIDLKNSHNNTLLIVAAKMGRVPFVDYLITCGANVNIQDSNGNTFLHHNLTKISQKQHHEIISKALKHGFKLDITNKAGKTAYDIGQTLNLEDSLLTLLKPSNQSDGSVPYENNYMRLNSISLTPLFNKDPTKDNHDSLNNENKALLQNIVRENKVERINNKIVNV